MPFLLYKEQVQAAVDNFFFLPEQIAQKISASPGERQSDLTAQPLYFTCMLGCRTDMHLYTRGPHCHPFALPRAPPGACSVTSGVALHADRCRHRYRPIAGTAAE